MAEVNTEWGNCIAELLKQHGLTPRAARLKAGGRPSHTTINDWMSGIVPKDKELAMHFLAQFPKEEAAKCLAAAGITVPVDWAQSTADPVQRVQYALNGELLDDYQLTRIQELLQKHRKPQ